MWNENFCNYESDKSPQVRANHNTFAANLLKWETSASISMYTYTDTDTKEQMFENHAALYSLN